MLIRGVPVERYDKERASKIYWGVGTYLGAPWPQNAKGHLLGDVTDQGRSISDPTARGNEIGGVRFPFHSDGSDLVGLFCLDAGASGGASLVANAVTIHNELVRTEPELAAELYAPFPYDFRGEQAPGTKSWYTMPIFSRCDDRLFVRYIRPYIESTRRHEDAPRPSEAARAAMDRVDAMCADPEYHVSMLMQPGDMQFVNNYHVLHARDSYEDDRAAAQDPPPQAAVARDRRARQRREARTVPPRPHRRLLGEQGPHQERAPDLRVRPSTRGRGAWRGAAPQRPTPMPTAAPPRPRTCCWRLMRSWFASPPNRSAASAPAEARNQPAAEPSPRNPLVNSSPPMSASR